VVVPGRRPASGQAGIWDWAAAAPPPSSSPTSRPDHPVDRQRVSLYLLRRPVPVTSRPAASQSVVRWASRSDVKPRRRATSFFVPEQRADSGSNDTDLGSGCPVALPSSFAPTAHPNLHGPDSARTAGFFLMDRTNLGGPASNDQQCAGHVLGRARSGLLGPPGRWGGNALRPTSPKPGPAASSMKYERRHQRGRARRWASACTQRA